MHLVHYADRFGNLSEAVTHLSGVAVLGVLFDVSHFSVIQLHSICILKRTISTQNVLINIYQSHVLFYHLNSFRL